MAETKSGTIDCLVKGGGTDQYPLTGRVNFGVYPDLLAVDILNIIRKVATAMQPLSVSTVCWSRLSPGGAWEPIPRGVEG